MKEIECALCKVKHVVEENISDLTCIICETNIIQESNTLNKIPEQFDIDDLDDILDLDLDDFPELDADDIEVMDKSNYNTDENRILTMLFKELNEDEFIIEEYNGESYSKMIKDFKVTPLSINPHQFNYIPSEPKNIFARFLYLRSKTKKNGILSLIDDIKTEPNPILRLALAICLEGYEPKTINKLMENKKYWFKQIYLNHSLSKEKKLYIENVMLDFDAIIAGIMIIQGGDDYPKLLQVFQSIYKNVDLKYKTIEEFEISKKEYLSMNDSYLLLNDEDTKYTNNLHGKELDLTLLDIFNKKRDALQAIEMYVLEDTQGLAKRLLLYSISARKNGVVDALVHASLKDKNQLIRHLFQQLVLGYNPDSVSGYCDEYIQNQLLLASEYHSKEFLLLYSRELELIREITMSLQGGDDPLAVMLKIMSYYPERTFPELLSILKKELSDGI